MKVLLILIVALNTNSIYADQSPSIAKPKVTISSTKEPTLEDIDKRINVAKEYLNKLPKNISQTQKEFVELIEKKNQTTEMVKRYLTFSKHCSTAELSATDEDMCRYANKSNLGTLIKTKKNQLINAIIFINEKLKGLQAELDKTNTIRDGITVLEDVQKILMGSIAIIEKHKYQKIKKIAQIKKLKNMKTFSLFPNNLSTSDKNLKKYKRYKKVLDLIQELQQYAENTSKIEEKKINNFILLTKEKALEDEPITPKNYNYKLSNQIISIIENNSTLSFKGEGPFLVTTMGNIMTDENITYLSVDLSPFDNSAIDEIVNSYKEHLEEKGMDDFTFLEKLKSKILSIVVKANENIRTVQMAVAGEL